MQWSEEARAWLMLENVAWVFVNVGSQDLILENRSFPSIEQRRACGVDQVTFWLNCLLGSAAVESPCCLGETNHPPHPQASHSGLMLTKERYNHGGHVCKLAVCHHVIC